MTPHATETEPHETAEHGTREAAAAARRHDADALMHVRASDIEPYIGLRYLSKLFRFMAIILVLLLVAEVITGLVQQGRAAIPTLLGEMSRLIVLAGLLWGTGDLAILLIDVGHDVRATRILMGRQIAHHVAVEHAHPEEPTPAEEAAPHRRATEIRTR
ncbi:MAG TPA: hypothetical protein VFZ21_01525 [Gemmatimonadaceae bacterium]|nr:hypothetical protein [Gemmatimonadaceae bacterium]